MQPDIVGLIKHNQDTKIGGHCIMKSSLFKLQAHFLNV